MNRFANCFKRVRKLRCLHPWWYLTVCRTSICEEYPCILFSLFQRASVTAAAKISSWYRHKKQGLNFHDTISHTSNAEHQFFFFFFPKRTLFFIFMWVHVPCKRPSKTHSSKFIRNCRYEQSGSEFHGSDPL